MKSIPYFGRWKALEKGSFRLTRAARHTLVCWRGELLLAFLHRASRVCRKGILRAAYLFLLRALVRRTELFDESYYLDLNPDVGVSQHTALGHFVAYGDREGRWPMPLFDPNYYRSKAGVEPLFSNSLLHYAYVGRYRGRSPSTWFDLRHYVANNRDVLRSGIDPLLHFMRFGGAEGRSPNPQFDAAYYLRSNPDVAEAGLNPLLHYVQFGRHEGRATRGTFGNLHHPEDTRARKADLNEPEKNYWEDLTATRNVFDDEPAIDVVIPVYRNAALTRRCLRSVLTARSRTAFRIVVVDDCSPEDALKEDLGYLARRGWITLHVNPVNRGFVASVNLGMSLQAARDIVLLNSDTEVYDGWLDLLRDCAYREDKVASVTPLSNNATICSYPRFLHDNPYPLELSYPELAKLASEVNKGACVEAPTGVGFCMYLKRDAIAAIGLFNEKLFGRGYGEENDWCQRAIANGYRNLIAADVFVRHFGAASFQGEKGKRVAHAMKVMARLFPSYHDQVRRFIETDPLLDLRRKLDWARLGRQVKARNALMVSHNRGGGSEKHLQEDALKLAAEGKGVFFMRPDKDRPGCVRVQHGMCRQLLNLGSFLMSDPAQLSVALGRLRITEVHSHGLVDFDADAPLQLTKVCEMIGASLHVDIHDYKVICPRVNLVDSEGHYCGEPEANDCNRCLAENGNDFGVRDISAWRSAHHQALRFARRISVPNQDVAQRLHRYFPDLALDVVPHEEDCRVSPVRNKPVSTLPSQRIKIVTLGAINKSKGYQVLMNCAKDSQKRKLPIDFIVMGYTMNDGQLKKCGVTITGRYDDMEAPELLESLDPHIVWLPSTWPETYSYTLSIAQRKSYPVTAFDLGAIAQRCRDRGDGFLLPLELARKPSELNDTLLSFASSATLPEASC